MVYDGLQSPTSAFRNGEFSQLWELLDADWEKKLWGIPH